MMVPGVKDGDGLYSPQWMTPAVGSLYFVAVPALELSDSGSCEYQTRLWRLAIPDIKVVACSGVWAASC